MMTLEQEGAYIRLVAYCWQHGSIPRDPKEAARLIGKGASTTLAESVLQMFIPAIQKGRLTHDRLEEQRARQEAWREKSAKGGRKSAEMRSKGGSTVVQPPYQPKANTPTPTPTPVLAERERHFPEANGKMTLQEVKDTAKMIGLGEWKAVDWFQEMEGCGWMDHNNRPIQDGRAVLARVKTKWESDGRPSSPPKPKDYGNNKGSASGKPNPRNFGIVRGPTDYATAKPRLQREREEAEAARVAGQVAATQNNPPSVAGG